MLFATVYSIGIELQLLYLQYYLSAFTIQKSFRYRGKVCCMIPREKRTFERIVHWKKYYM